MIRGERTWTAETLHTMRVIAAVLGNILARCESDETLRQSILQIEHARDRIRVESAVSPARGPGTGRQRRHHRPEPGHPRTCSNRHDRWPRPIRRCCCWVRRAPARSSSPTHIHETERAARTDHGAGQLLGDPEHADGERALRPREGRVHRGARASDRTLRAGRPFDDFPRRDRRVAVRRPGQAVARPRGAADRAARQPERRARGRADHRGDASESREADWRGHVSRGSVLPAQRVSDPGSAAATIASKTFRCSCGASWTSSRRRSASGSRRSRARTWRCCSGIRGRATSASCATSSSAR